MPRYDEPEPSDEHLMRDAQGGDAEAFEQLLLRHERRLFGYMVRLSGNSSAAEDLLQEVFLAVYRHRARYRYPEPVRPWVYAIARNFALKWVRARSTRERHIPPTETSEPGPERAAERAELKERLRDALAHLPENERECIELVVLQELTFAETGRLTGVPESTVRLRVSRALSRLARLVEMA